MNFIFYMMENHFYTELFKSASLRLMDFLTARNSMALVSSLLMPL